MYENDFANYARIVGTLFAFWLFQGMHWWCIFELGINKSQILTWYSVGIFVAAIIVGAGMLLSGKIANRIKRHHEHLVEIIAEKKAIQEEDKNRKKQDEEYQRKIAIAKEEATAKAAQDN